VGAVVHHDGAGDLVAQLLALAVPQQPQVGDAEGERRQHADRALGDHLAQQHQAEPGGPAAVQAQDPHAEHLLAGRRPLSRTIAHQTR
jgi:hypothetical protein